MAQDRKKKAERREQKAGRQAGRQAGRKEGRKRKAWSKRQESQRRKQKEGRKQQQQQQRVSAHVHRRGDRRHTHVLAYKKRTHAIKLNTSTKIMETPGNSTSYKYVQVCTVKMMCQVHLFVDGAVRTPGS